MVYFEVVFTGKIFRTYALTLNPVIALAELGVTPMPFAPTNGALKVNLCKS